MWLNGKEYRLATYKGAKIKRCEDGIMEIKQGKLLLSVKVNRQNAFKLPAPKRGFMERIIKESASCHVEYLLTKNRKTIFQGQSKYGSYEYSES